MRHLKLVIEGLSEIGLNLVPEKVHYMYVCMYVYIYIALNSI